jgi:hypothetical protein
VAEIQIFKVEIEVKKDEILSRYFGNLVRGHQSSILDLRHPESKTVATP